VEIDESMLEFQVWGAKFIGVCMLGLGGCFGAWGVVSWLRGATDGLLLSVGLVLMSLGLLSVTHRRSHSRR